MTQDMTPFDHRTDPVLGAALRHALTGGDDAAFVAGVLARARHLATGSWDAVLARWARVGVAAAAVLALAAGYVARTSAAPVAPGHTSVADALLARSTQSPEAEAVLASVIGN
jgi:hypothetical protein